LPPSVLAQRCAIRWSETHTFLDLIERRLIAVTDGLSAASPAAEAENPISSGQEQRQRR
jgi:hypothetical protein